MSVEPLNQVNPLIPGTTAQPYAPPMQAGIVSNQVAPFQVLGEMPVNSLHGSFAVCPSCRTPVYSRINRQFSCVSCITYFCCGPCWMLHKCSNGKDYSCYDAEHTCPKCNAHLGTYKSC